MFDLFSRSTQGNLSVYTSEHFCVQHLVENGHINLMKRGNKKRNFSGFNASAFENLNDLLERLGKREREIASYKQLFERFPEEVAEYRKTFKFLNGDPLNQIIFSYMDENNLNYGFSFFPETQTFIVYKRDGEMLKPYKTYSYEHLEEGQELFVKQMYKYGLKKMLRCSE